MGYHPCIQACLCHPLASEALAGMLHGAAMQTLLMAHVASAGADSQVRLLDAKNRNIPVKIV